MQSSNKTKRKEKMSKTRRTHSPTLKAKVALAAVRGDKTIVELSQQFQVHPNQIQTWKKQLLDGAAEIFQKGSGQAADQSVAIKELHAKIGQLAMEKDFLSKALGGLV